jgi:excisionase family DNA binding protein
MTYAELTQRARKNRTEFITRNRKVYITQREAAEILGVTDRTIRNMIADGRLRAYRLGAAVIRLRLDEVEAALQPIGGAA